MRNDMIDNNRTLKYGVRIEVLLFQSTILPFFAKHLFSK